MILASDRDERRGRLDELAPLQQGDFERIFEAMGGLPVTIRLLDPPLHEFLPRALPRRRRAAGGSAAKQSDERCEARAHAGPGASR